MESLLLIRLKHLTTKELNTSGVLAWVNTHLSKLIQDRQYPLVVESVELDKLIEDNLPPWRCFHCGEVFTNIGSAEEHFGSFSDSVAGCVIQKVAYEEGGKPEQGRGLLIALRRAEQEIKRLTSEREDAENELASEHAGSFQNERRVRDAIRPGWTVERMVELMHGNIPSHGGFAYECNQWPCVQLFHTKHTFTRPCETQLCLGADKDLCIFCGCHRDDRDKHIHLPRLTMDSQLNEAV